MSIKTPMSKLLDGLKWKKLPALTEDFDLPYATHVGVLRIGELSLRVYQLTTGERVINQEDLEKFFGCLGVN